MHWRNREKQNDETSWKGKFFSSSWVLECLFFVLRNCLPHFICCLLCIPSCRKMFKQLFTDVFQDRCSWKFCNIHRKTPVLESLFNKVTGPKSCIFTEKEPPSQVFSCEYCKVFKNRCFIEYLFILFFWKFMWWQILDIWRLYLTVVKLGYITERTSR